MSGRTRGVAAGLAIGLSAAALLHQMRAELITTGRLSKPTVRWMYAAYGTHAAATAAALVARAGPLRVPRLAVWLGGGLTATGTALVVAGMRRFAGPGQVSGTDPGPLITGGVYRFSRNPQYTGYVLALGGLALARRSGGGAAAAAAVGIVYRWWIPVEERHLKRQFGTDYRTYLNRTSRWLGRPRSG
ncbi:MAG: methyltransferase family protein [Pseudonocardiaceae bacterium]